MEVCKGDRNKTMEGLVRHAKMVRFYPESSKILPLKNMKQDRVQSTLGAKSPELNEIGRRARAVRNLACTLKRPSPSIQTALFQEGMMIDQPLENLHM